MDDETYHQISSAEYDVVSEIVQRDKHGALRPALAFIMRAVGLPTDDSFGTIDYMELR